MVCVNGPHALLHPETGPQWLRMLLLLVCHSARNFGPISETNQITGWLQCTSVMSLVPRSAHTSSPTGLSQQVINGFRRNFYECVRRGPRTNRLDFDDDLNHDPDTGFLNPDQDPEGFRWCVQYMTSPGHPFYLRSKGQMSRSAWVCTLVSASPLAVFVSVVPSCLGQPRNHLKLSQYPRKQQNRQVPPAIFATPKAAHNHAIRHRYVVTTGACWRQDSIDFDWMTAAASEDCRALAPSRRA